MIRTLITDDEQHALDRLKDLLSAYPEFEIVAEANSGTEALEKIVTLNPDVAFLDINMPGVSIFKTLSSLSDPPIIIFQTAHSKYAADAFDVDALDYLLKPISRERFQKAISKIQDRISKGKPASVNPESSDKETKEKITIKQQGSIKIVALEEVQKICFEEGLTFICTANDRFISDRSLNYYEEKYKDQGFFRSNRANLINLEFVTTIHKGFKGNFLVELKDGSKVELSRRKAQVLKKQLDF